MEHFISDETDEPHYPSILAQILIGAGILAFALSVFGLALLALSLAAQ